MSRRLFRDKICVRVCRSSATKDALYFWKGVYRMETFIIFHLYSFSLHQLTPEYDLGIRSLIAKWSFY